MADAPLILNRYRVLATLGSGGFGEVLLAWDPRIQRKVALKKILLTSIDAQRSALDDAASQEFHALSHIPGIDEARTAALLKDEHIVTIYDVAICDSYAYLIMEYIEGITLTQLMERYAHNITLDALTALFDGIAAALSVAHRASVLHLDIKPDNILITPDGKVKVTDFGLATLLDAAGRGQTAGGTIGYMPLEQITRQHLDVRTDEWALASLTYCLIAQENPFKASTLEEAQHILSTARIALPSACWEEIAPEIDDVLLYALDPNPDNRYASIDDFAEEMDRFLGDAACGAEDLELCVRHALDHANSVGADGSADEGAGAGAGSTSSKHNGAGHKHIWSLLTGFFSKKGNQEQPAPHSRAYGVAQGVKSAGWDILERAAARVEANDTLLLEQQQAAHERRLQEELPQSGRGARSAGVGTRGSRGAGGAGGAGGATCSPHGLFSFSRCRERLKAMNKLISPRVVSCAARVVSACGSAFLLYLATMNIPYAFSVPYFAFPMIAAMCGAVLGAVFPPLGAVVGFMALSIAFILSNVPWLGIVLVALTLAWYSSLGKNRTAATNFTTSAIVLSAFGGAPLAFLGAGCVLKPLQALISSVYSCIWLFIFASLGAQNVYAWDIISHGSFFALDVGSNLMQLLCNAQTYILLAGLLLACVLQSLFAMADKRLVDVVGTFGSGIVLAISAACATWVNSNFTNLFIPSQLLVIIAFSVLLVALFQALVRPR
ncbi:kinase domain protein [Umbribacter vaginalis]|nr:kinase domain protein [Coriobacteriales bacterium DNF00809]